MPYKGKPGSYYKKLIEHEFWKFFPSADFIVAHLKTKTDAIEVEVDGEIWHHDIGSDDDGFSFYNTRFADPFSTDGCKPAMAITFDFPKGWFD